MCSMEKHIASVRLPPHAAYVIIGAGIHGLSTAWHLAKELKVRRRGSGKDIIVLDKTGIAAGASGIACGVIRNNYFQPAMRELMAHSVSVWESNPKAFAYHPVGYMQLSPEVMHNDVATIAKQQKEIGYTSEFIEGPAESKKYMRSLFDDWKAEGITSVLHEKKGGYANNVKSMQGLAAKAQNEGVRIISGVTVTGFNSTSNAVSEIKTDHGNIQTDHVIVSVGPWVKSIWDMLELPKQINIKDNEGKMHHDIAMWTYWCLQEGTLGVDPSYGMRNNGSMPPVIHLDTDTPLYSDIDGSLITDRLWGIYYKPDFNFGGIQGGSMPYKIKRNPDDVAVDPYGPKSPEFVVSEDFATTWCSMLAFCQKRFEGQYQRYKHEPSGGIGCFTPDSFPVFDIFRQNVYIIADSNHGYKMIGVGALVAKELMDEPQELLKPFRFSRYELGKLHPISNSPFPWS